MCVYNLVVVISLFIHCSTMVMLQYSSIVFHSMMSLYKCFPLFLVCVCVCVIEICRGGCKREEGEKGKREIRKGKGGCKMGWGVLK